MLYSDSLREMMQNGLNESFWDGLGVEIEACANFKRKLGIRDIFPVPAKITEPRKILGLDALGMQLSGATDPGGAHPGAKMLAAASILAPGWAPPGSVAPESCIPRASNPRIFLGSVIFAGTGKISRIPSFLLKFAHASISTPSPSQKLSFSPFCIISRKESE